MKTKLMALSLTLAILACMFAGCANDEAAAAEETATDAEVQAEEETTAEATETEDAATEESATEETATEETAEEETTTEETAAEESAVGVTAGTVATADSTITYPIDTTVVLTTWRDMSDSYYAYAEEYNDSEVMAYAEDLTGVQLDVSSVSQSTSDEQYNLMVASGEWPDFCRYTKYSGGLAQAYADEFCIEITDEQLSENAPDYYTVRQSLDTNSYNSTLVDGKTLGLFTIKDQVLLDEGMFIRTDWLDECGLSIPTNLEEFTNVLETFYITYGGEYTLYFTGGFDFLNDCFNTDCVGYTNANSIPGGNAAFVPVHLMDGAVTCSWTDSGFYDYIEWVAEMVETGVINSEFYNESSSQVSALVAKDDTGVFSAMAGQGNQWQNYVTDDTDPDLSVSPMANPTDEDGVYNWNAEENVIGDGYLITSNCENVDLVLNYINFYFTSDGIILSNYGAIDWTCAYDAQGEIYLTEVLTDNEFGINIGAAMGIYTMNNLVPHYADEERRHSALSDEELNAYDVFNNADLSSDHYFPDAAVLTVEESDLISGTVADLVTIAEEMLLSMMAGQSAATEESWQSFVDTLYDNGLQEVLDLYQTVYDEYMAGER